MTPQESLSFPREQTVSDLAAGDRVCPVCSRDARDEYIALADLSDDLQKLIRANAPGKKDCQEVCGRCARLFERAKEHIIKDAAVLKDGSHVLSTPLRLDADERFTGNGV